MARRAGTGSASLPGIEISRGTGYAGIADVKGVWRRAAHGMPVHGPPWAFRQSPRSLRNLLVYCSAVVPETELQVGDAYVCGRGAGRVPVQ